jgi:L-threonylcarbamoyladenylate synthase
MNYLPVSPDSLNQAAVILRNGGLVAFPTETVYGLGADAFNPQALAKVFEVKGRPRFDPLIIHIAAIETLERVANLSLLNNEIKQKLFLLAENFWPGPLSIILPKNEKIPDLATAGLKTAAIRFPDHETACKLISLSSGAVAAPSANPFGCLSPTKAEHVRDGLGEKVDLILDGGSTRIGLESTVLDITGDCIKILRPGGTPKEAIEKACSKTMQTKGLRFGTGSVSSVLSSQDSEHKGGACISPGLLESHYAPGTPLSVFDREGIINQPYETGSVYLFFDGLTRDTWSKVQNPPKHPDIIRVLSESGSALEAASRLFEVLHELDNGRILRIYAQLAHGEGLAEAINDRLNRASVKR